MLRNSARNQAVLPTDEQKHGQTALLTCDVWEHSCYPTYKNARPKYVEVFLNNLVNRDFLASHFAKSRDLAN